MGQAQVVYLDTHVVVWLYEGNVKRIGKDAARAIERLSPVASPAAVYELGLMFERGRIARSARTVIDALAMEIGLTVCNLPFLAVVEAALSEGWTREPMDRLIVANAKAAGAPLVTADQNIHKHYSRAIW